MGEQEAVVGPILPRPLPAADPNSATRLPFARRVKSVDWGDTPEPFVESDRTPSEGVPALGAKRGKNRPPAVPELDPEGQGDGYFAPQPSEEDADPDTESEQGYESSGDSATDIHD